MVLFGKIQASCFTLITTLVFVKNARIEFACLLPYANMTRGFCVDLVGNEDAMTLGSHWRLSLFMLTEADDKMPAPAPTQNK